MKYKYLITSLLFLILIGCASSKVNKSTIESLQTKLQQKQDQLDYAENRTKLLAEKLSEIQALNIESRAENYFTTLESSDQVTLSSFFKKGESLKKGNEKLVKIISTKLKFQDGEIKYFALQNGGYGIITKLQCITLEGTKKAGCTEENRCSFFNPACIEIGYSQFLLFLVTKKDMEGNEKFTMDSFNSMIIDKELDSNYNSLEVLKKLLSDDNKYNEDYSFTIRLFQIKKAQLAKPIIIEPTYNFKEKMHRLFNN